MRVVGATPPHHSQTEGGSSPCLLHPMAQHQLHPGEQLLHLLAPLCGQLLLPPVPHLCEVVEGCGEGAKGLTWHLLTARSATSSISCLLSAGVGVLPPGSPILPAPGPGHLTPHPALRLVRGSTSTLDPPSSGPSAARCTHGGVVIRQTGQHTTLRPGGGLLIDCHMN